MNAVRKAGEERFRELFEKIKVLKYKREKTLDELGSIHCQLGRYKTERQALSTELFRDRGVGMDSAAEKTHPEEKQ